MSPAGGLPYPPGAGPPPGAPPGVPPGASPGGAGPEDSPVRGFKDSLLHPLDSLRHAARGRLNSDMSVRDAMEMIGVDVDGPVSQLTGAVKGQLQGATTEGKLTAPTGGGPPAEAPPPASPPPGAPPPGGAPSPQGQGGGLGSILGGRR